MMTRTNLTMTERIKNSISHDQEWAITYLAKVDKGVRHVQQLIIGEREEREGAQIANLEDEERSQYTRV